MKHLKRSQVSDWIKHSEVAKCFSDALEIEVERVYEESAQTFVSGDPNATQERKAKLIGREHMLNTLLAFFKDGAYEAVFNEANGVIVLENDNDEQ